MLVEQLKIISLLRTFPFLLSYLSYISSWFHHCLSSPIAFPLNSPTRNVQKSYTSFSWLLLEKVKSAHTLRVWSAVRAHVRAEPHTLSCFFRYMFFFFFLFTLLFSFCKITRRHLQLAKSIENHDWHRGTQKTERGTKRTANKGDLSEDKKKDGNEKLCIYARVACSTAHLYVTGQNRFSTKSEWEKTGQEVSKLRLESFKKVLAPRVCSQ